jgi:hypothetical protein
MKKTDPARPAINQLLRTALPNEQHEARAALRGADSYIDALSSVYFQNPFFQLTDNEAEALRSGIGLDEPLAGLVSARHRAMRPSGARYVIFCMPKSGSSFVRTALEEALQLPGVSLTSFGDIRLSSLFGMNPREQELDELALVKAALMEPQGFVAQHHTRYTQYLGLQMRAYGITPIVTLRHIPDALVSFDDMMLDWRSGPGPTTWARDTPFALPLDYVERAPDVRLRLLARSLGVWLIQFHLSWLRGTQQGFVRPLVIRYEDDILQPERLSERLCQALKLDDAQAQRLQAFVARPDPERSRLNVGKAGRGRERAPDDVISFLRDYAASFAGEIPPADVEALVG